jgi:hypothetical protein
MLTSAIVSPLQPIAVTAIFSDPRLGSVHQHMLEKDAPITFNIGTL